MAALVPICSIWPIYQNWDTVSSVVEDTSGFLGRDSKSLSISVRYKGLIIDERQIGGHKRAKLRVLSSGSGSAFDFYFWNNKVGFLKYNPNIIGPKNNFTQVFFLFYFLLNFENHYTSQVFRLFIFTLRSWTRWFCSPFPRANIPELVWLKCWKMIGFAWNPWWVIKVHSHTHSLSLEHWGIQIFSLIICTITSSAWGTITSRIDPLRIFCNCTRKAYMESHRCSLSSVFHVWK